MPACLWRPSGPTKRPPAAHRHPAGPMPIERAIRPQQAIGLHETGTRTGLKGRQHITPPIGGQTGPGDESITGLHGGCHTAKSARPPLSARPTPRPPKTVAARPGIRTKQDCAVIRKTPRRLQSRSAAPMSGVSQNAQGLLHGLLNTGAAANHRNTGRCWAHPASRPRQCVAGLWVPCP